MPEIISVTSESLQSTVRQLLPSQQGFGDDLQATNLITPIIDLTAAAEGSNLPRDLQTALSLNSQTEYQVSNNTSTIVTAGGFYRNFGSFSCENDGAGSVQVSFQLTDGTTTKKILFYFLDNNQTLITHPIPFDFYVFLNAGESLQAVSNTSKGIISGSVRSVADQNGNLVNPAGFTPQ